ncbi:MAG: NAD-binding protein [Desulfurococcaceae archaeon]|jgi:trk system potassium uptake protein TrkA
MARLKVLIVGGGRVTELLLSSQFAKEKFEEVIVIEKDSSRRPILERLGDVLVIEADASDASVYNNINMQEVNAVLALTDRDEVNLLALSVAKVYEVPIRIGLFSNFEVARIASKLQLGLPLTKHTIVTSILKYILASITEAHLLAETPTEKLYVVTISESDFSANSKLGDLKLEENGAKPILVFQDSELKPVSEDTILTPGSVLFVLAPDDSFIRKIRG